MRNEQEMVQNDVEVPYDRFHGDVNCPISSSCTFFVFCDPPTRPDNLRRWWTGEAAAGGGGTDTEHRDTDSINRTRARLTQASGDRILQARQTAGSTACLNKCTR